MAKLKPYTDAMLFVHDLESGLVTMTLSEYAEQPMWINEARRIYRKHTKK